MESSVNELFSSTPHSPPPLQSGRETADRLGKGYPTDMSLTAAFFEAKEADGGSNATAYGALPPSNDGSCVAAAGKQFYDALPLGCWCCGDFYHPKSHYSVKLAESRVRYWDTPSSGVG